MPHREWKRVPDHRSCVLKGSLPQGSSAHPRNMEYPRLSEKSEKVSRDEANRRGMRELHQRQRGSRWELICIESGSCIIIIKPRENKRGNESFGGFIRKILSDWTYPPDLQVSKLTEFLRPSLQCKLAVKNYTKFKREMSFSNGKGSLGHYHCHWHWHVCYISAVLLRLFYINGTNSPLFTRWGKIGLSFFTFIQVHASRRFVFNEAVRMEQCTHLVNYYYFKQVINIKSTRKPLPRQVSYTVWQEMNRSETSVCETSLSRAVKPWC